MSLLAMLGGVLLVLLVLRDVFHTLLHPSSEGRLSRHVLRGVWRAARSFGVGGATRGGPLAFVAVGAVWTLLLVLGFALLYWPRLDDAFVFASQLDPSAQHGFLDALYFSSVTVATLGYGDFVATTWEMRAVSVVQGLTGLALVTAVVSWLLSLYSALHRIRALAGSVVALVDGDPPSAQLVERLAADVQAVRTDLTQQTAAYYFRSADPSLELAAALPALRELALRTEEKGATLLASLDLLAAKLGRDFLDCEGAATETVLRAYAVDHLVATEAEALRARAAAV